MSFKSTLNLNSQIFDAAQRKAAGGRAARKAARKFRDETRKKMVFGKPSGKIYERDAGDGFVRRHRASRRGEVPAVLTGNLANKATKFRSVSATSAETYIDTDVAPYADDLLKMERHILTDLDDAQKDLDHESEKELAKLL